MSADYRRNRTSSAYEEQNVTSFVDTCLKYKCNLTFSTTEAPLASTVLLLGTDAQLKDAATTPLFQRKEITAAIARVSANNVCATFSDDVRIIVGRVTTEASRYNSPTRPDVITDLVGKAQSDAGTSPLTIYALSKDYMCVAAAIARAYHPFSAKRGDAERGYRAPLPNVTVIFPGATVSTNHLSIVATKVQLAMLLFDAPTNLLDTTTFTEIAVRYAAACGCTAEVIAGEDLREQGYGGIYGVGKAAEFPPALVTLKYAPSNAIESIALVGKGIVYDTGGLAIKTPATFMSGMKGDMGGAAAVFAGFLVAVELGLPISLTCTLCLADNAIGPRSQRNDDIVRLKSGLTSELNNTDAEGRLVLSDGIFKATSVTPPPNIVIDMATLTGAQGIATGHRHAGVVANTDEIERRALVAGRASGDLVMPLLYCPELLMREFSSTVADHRNSVAARDNASSSCAGHYVESNIAPAYKGHWLHVDLAFPTKHAGFGTGFGVALLVQIFQDTVAAASK